MSGNFTQRGNISIIDKYTKTEIILNHVDLVVELPYQYATQSADYFAKGAIEILKNLKCDYICFGSESGDINTITNQKENKNIKQNLKKGLSYPKALNQIDTPNDILGACYLREIKKQKANIKPYIIKRTNDYHETNNKNKISSATSIRNALYQGKNIKHNVPKETYKALKLGLPSKEMQFSFLKYKIITEDIKRYEGVDEGLENRIKEKINQSTNINELILEIKSKRYTYNRISRMLCHIYTGYTKEDHQNNKDKNFIRILGLNEKGKQIIKEAKKDSQIPIITRTDKQNQNLLKIEKQIDSSYLLLTTNKVKQKTEEINKKNHPIN